MYAMSMLRRSALALLALCLTASARAADPLPAELESLHAKAEAGNAIAQYNLGLACAKGYGVPVDQAEAYVWLTLAAEQGATGKDLNALLTVMPPETLAEGRRQLSRLQIALSAENDRAFDRIAQLAHIAGPIMSH